MPLFYFDITDGTFEQDFAGSELASLDQARAEAVRFAGELLRFHSDLLWEGHDLRVEVLDEDRIPMFAVRTSALVLFPPP